MRTARAPGAVCVAFVLAAAAAHAAAPFGEYSWVGRPGVPVVADELLVKFKAGAAAAAIAGVHRRHGTAEIYTSPFGGFKRIRIPAGMPVAQAVARLSAEPAVEYAEPNSVCRAFMTPDDPYYGNQWHFTNPDGGGINLPPAWDEAQGSGVIVAVIDTGIAYENYKRFVRAPDLEQASFVAGYDFVNNDTHPNDDNSHGTHVAGTIAQSTNNALGVAGIAFQCSLMPVKVLNKLGQGT